MTLSQIVLAGMAIWLGWLQMRPTRNSKSWKQSKWNDRGGRAAFGDRFELFNWLVQRFDWWVMRSLLVLTILVVGAAVPGSSDDANLIQISVGKGFSVPDVWMPILNLYSFTNCSNDGRNMIGDRLNYQGSAYLGCNGPTTYSYDKGPPSQTVEVYVITSVAVQPDRTFLATFRLFNDSGCLYPYDFLPTRSGVSTNQISQLENSCQIYTPDLYNATAVVSASVLIGSASTLSSLPLALLLLIAAGNAAAQTQN